MPDPWRFRCPEGHAGYSNRATRGVIRCRSCGEDYGHKLDAKTGMLVPA